MEFSGQQGQRPISQPGQLQSLKLNWLLHEFRLWKKMSLAGSLQVIKDPPSQHTDTYYFPAREF